MMRSQTFFMTHTGIQIPVFHEMCRETLNPRIGTVTSNSNLQIVFVPILFHDVHFNSCLANKQRCEKRWHNVLFWL